MPEKTLELRVAVEISNPLAGGLIDKHEKSYDRYLAITVKAVGIYMTSSSFTLLLASYKEGLNRAGNILFIQVAVSLTYAFVFFVGAMKWMKKRRSYLMAIKDFNLEQADDTEMLTVALFASVAMFLAIVIWLVRLF